MSSRQTQKVTTTSGIQRIRTSAQSLVVGARGIEKHSALMKRTVK